MVFKIIEPHFEKDNNWRQRSIENNTKNIKKGRLDLMINQQFFYNTEATLIKNLQANKKIMRLASRIRNAKFKIVPLHPKTIFR